MEEGRGGGEIVFWVIRGGGGMGGSHVQCMKEWVICVRNRDVAYWVAMAEEGGTYTHADSM